jgi:hypothetical protein
MAAERQGLLLVLATSHIGGMETGGLNRTGVGRREVIGGFPLQFYWRAGLHYDMDRHGKEVSWYPEPHTALANQTIQDIGTTELTRRLKQQGVVLEYVPSSQAPILQLIPRMLPANPLP